MSRFIIYTYQFSPIKTYQGSLFQNDKVLPVEERMAKKQEIFESLFSQNLKYIGRSGEHKIKMLYNRDHFIVFKLANNSYQQIELDFQVNKYAHNPSCVVIIDNRHDVQHIAIQDISSFSDTNVVANILETAYSHYLQPYGLRLHIKRDFQESEFWNIVKQHPAITMVRFHFSYPNLPRTLSSVNKMIAEASAKTNSKKTTFEFQSDPDECLVLEKSNRKLAKLAKASADSGHTIMIKAKDVRRFISTGNTFKSIEIGDITFVYEGDNLLQSPTERLAAIFNKIK